MSRPTSKTTAPVDAVVVSETALQRVADTQDALAALDQQTQANVRAVALKVGYQLPGDCIDPDLIQRDIAANMRRSVEACLEVGRGLSTLKAACPHGSFMARLDVLGVDHTVAKRFMQAAFKFSNGALTHHMAKAIGNQTKLFEMLVLDDEQIEGLALTGEFGDIKLDDIATMSVKELRAALRQEKENSKFIAEKRDKESARADSAEKALRAGGPTARKLEDQVTEFSKDVSEQREVTASGILSLDQQIKGLDKWITDYAVAQPGYDPEARFDLPVEVMALVQKLHSDINSIASAVGGLQHLFYETFGGDLEKATTYHMQAPGAETV